MKKHLLTIAFAIASLFAFTSTANVAHATPLKADVVQQTNPFIIENVSYHLNGQATTGTLTITRFIVKNGVLYALGTLTGVTGILQIPVTNMNGTCQILHLELGPVDLNLLGLMVHLDQVVLDITAQSGPGNLLGNLLCAVANLLNNPSPNLNSIAALLNRIIGIFG